MKIKLSLRELEIVNDILDRYFPSVPIWVFGSRVSGESKPFSDLDLAIISTSPISFSILGKAKEAFIESDLPFSVDIVDWSTIPDTFQRKIKEQYYILR
ncbi:MAG: nucleotidyltransferase domain-containing protein [Candidatus Margulisbacteria bacterium]|nr:nucleotidyltransferase domain-containing protein [Candidatus Margulisiibacteriota bacterium]